MDVDVYGFTVRHTAVRVKKDKKEKEKTAIVS